LWFREGLALYLASPENPASPAADMSDQQMEAQFLHPTSREEMERAYAVARRYVKRLIERFGKQKVLSWLSVGVPTDFSSGRRVN
jgi:hypothetical protein